MDPFYLIVAPIFLIIVTVLVAAHEYGHYLFAKLSGMDVEEFSIGFGRKPMFTWMRRGTTAFTIRPWPLGGFVRIRGMVPEVDGSETQVPNGFYSKPPLSRLAVLFAGPLFSVLAGIVLLVGLLYVAGEPEPVKTPTIGQVMPRSVADQAGLKKGDVVGRIDGQSVHTWAEMTRFVRAGAGKPLRFEIRRGNSQVTLEATPKASEEPVPLLDDAGKPTGKMGVVGQIGVVPEIRNVPVGLGSAVARAADAPVKMVEGVLGVFLHPSSFSSMMGGPVSIVNATKDAARGGLFDVINLAAMLSISLGILNLLPVPPLDGGQMVVAFAELFRRGRRLSFAIQNAVNTVGLALVCMLIISVLAVDFQRFLIHPKAATVRTVR